MFDACTGQIGTMFLASCYPSILSKYLIKEGDYAELLMGEERILVYSLKAVAYRVYCGRIHGFMSSFAAEFDGLKSFQEVKFNQNQIFACISWA